ncbi:hypothetical protein ACPV47_16170 [Vibrio jasicida]|uniref:hypothetical protein n=1 Tax=Vibrio jasicida TaxID=766224 RepID=UPI004068B94C
MSYKNHVGYREYQKEMLVNYLEKYNEIECVDESTYELMYYFLERIIDIAFGVRIKKKTYGQSQVHKYIFLLDNTKWVKKVGSELYTCTCDGEVLNKYCFIDDSLLKQIK